MPKLRAMAGTWRKFLSPIISRSLKYLFGGTDLGISLAVFAIIKEEGSLAAYTLCAAENRCA